MPVSPLRPDDEVVTYVARELEPYRGYHSFMRALPQLMELRPAAQVVVVAAPESVMALRHRLGRPGRSCFTRKLLPASIRSACTLSASFLMKC